MSRWNIYHKDGTKLTDVNDDEVVVHGLQYSDKWMGDCFLTVDFKNNAPINFKIGDYIIYRGERFELNYEPGKDKKASLNTYGEGFVYDSVKFNALQDELSRSEFYDVVLNDNELHYTTLPKFPFYVQTLDDLLDRIQANLNEQIGVGLWKIYSRNMERSVQRGALKSEWMSVYGEGTSDNVIEPKSITVDGKTCWEALALVNSEWDVNFIVRGRNVYVGTAGVLANNIFKYGLGKGLSELIQNADSEQQIVTRLRAYGSEKNLPSHYYADLGTKYFCNITEVNTATSYLSVYIDMEYIDNYFTIPRVFVPNDGTGKEQTYGYVLKVTFDFQTIITCVVTALSSGQAVMLYSEVKNNMEDNGDEPSKENLDRFIAQVNAGNRKIYIVDGLNKKAVPSSMKEYAKNLPNNMSINRLMLPGFPHVSLNDYYNSLSKSDKEYVNPTGKEHVFSTNPYRPYIDSVNIQQIGLRSASQYFDNDDKTNGIVEIYPTIEEMVIGGVRVDEIDEGVAPNDDGRFEDGQTVNNVDIYLSPSIDFDINDLRDDDFSIAMKDGMCGGRTFKVASSVKENGRWRLTIQRVKDDALELWFPYKDYPIRKGDHFVLTGITLPDSYVNAASLKLLKYALAYIDKNDYTRYVYQPKVDEVFMARQNDQATEDKTGTIKSLHDTLKAGDIMEFDDDDLHIGGKVTIDQLVIRENEGGIPTYEVTLRNDVEVGTMAKIKQQISSLEAGNGKVSSETSKQITDSTINEASKHFLSKLKDDVAQGVITFAKGLIAKGLTDLMMGAKFGNNAMITELGDAVFNTIKSLDYDNAAEQGFSVEKEKNGKYHAFITNLTIWGKAIFNQLEVRKLSYAGGNVYLSGAGSKIVKVVPVIWESESSEWIETSVDKCEGWLCYLLADDGTTATMNYWQEGDQVRCQTIGEIVAGGAYSDTSNKSYWRTILDGGVSTQNEKIYGTKTETYLDEAGKEQTREVQVELYDGQAFAWIVVGKHSEGLDGYTEKNAPVEIKGDPAEGDTIVLDGNRHRNGNLEYDKTDRQNVIILETTGDYAPRIACYANISEYKHTITKSVNGENKEVSLSVFETSPKGGTKINSSHFELISDDGSTINIINYRGDWVEGNTYHKNDQVNHNNAVWVCVANSEEDVTGEPSDGSTQWKKVLSGSKGEKGEQGIKGDKGEDGAKGTDGEDAISILVEDAPLVFDTDDSGIVPVSISKVAKVKIMKGNLNISNECSNINSRDDLCVNCKCGAIQKDGYIEVSVSGSNIAKNDVIVDGVNQGQVSATSGYAVAQFVYAGVVYFVQVPFTVNVSKYMGSVKVTAKQYQSQFKALENDLKGSNPTVLKAYTSTIKQAAREISLSVSEKSIGRRNLLVGSAFLREDNNCTISKDARIEINSGYQGTNCIHVIDATEAGNPHYVGAYWDGSQGGRSIKIEKGKKYTMSCFYKTNDINGEFWLEATYTDKQENATRKGQAKYLSPNGHTVKKVNEWELFTTVVDTTDAEYDYIAFNFWEACNVIAGQINAWICRPMVEEGDTYNGWTLSQNDYDYVGGNLLEDTMALTRSSDNSNLQFASGLILFGKYEGCYGILYNKNNSAESQFTEALQYKFPTTATLSGQARIVKNQDYVFSFVAKGSGNINVYLYGDSVHANVFTETCEGNVYPVGWADGYTQLALTSTYKRYWVHWRINDYTGEGAEVIPDKVLIRVPGDTEAWVTKPKLEEGAQLTDYTERKTDLIDRATAKAAGLEITSSGITLYGEKIKVENTLSTGQTTTAALFKDGAINAALILAQMLTSQGHNGQMVRIADGLINIYGKAGTANIRFGLNSSGQAVLSYYDDNGNFLYDLGPAGIASLSKTDAKITSEQYIKAEDAGLTTPLGENVDLPWVDTTKSWYTATKDNNYILFVKGATGKKTTLYRYSAPRVNGKIVADSANGLSTYDLASAADGRTFTSRTMVKNGALTNLADGVFLTGDVTVYDNTKLVPSIKKGQSVTRPSFYVQTASFNEKFTTLGLFGRIYSIQTETTFGNLDVGIMSNNN